jgi:hypothetical protein
VSIRECAIADARACRDAGECIVNTGAYCVFGPSGECAELAADYLSMSAIEDAVTFTSAIPSGNNAASQEEER